MAGGLLKRIADDTGVALEVRTAGVAHHPDALVAEEAVIVMQERGVDISEEYSKPVTAEAMAWADVVLTVEPEHKEYLSEEYPSAERKFRSLGARVPDPYGGELSEYRQVRDQLEPLLRQFIRLLQKDL
ncbi:MAG: hypothetical protein HYX89_05380 [Chloroflexi bacterium]|nr:hypothetical protein [Chloroflexota bacterium]